MPRESIDDLEVLLTVAQEGSFTRAAAKLGVSQSALSQTVRSLEEKIGLRLLDRTTRSVSPTQAGTRLLDGVAPRIAEIRDEIAAIGALRDKPSGTVRITADEHAAKSTLWPRLVDVLRANPDIGIEIVVDYGLTDIVAERYDAGVRLGEIIDKDMIAVPIGPDERMVVVGSPSYIAKHGAPRKPQQLVDHRCINLRLPTRGGLYVWEFEKGGRALNVRVEGQCVFNSTGLMIDAALAGFGLAFVPEAEIMPHVARGALRTVLEDWCPSYSGYHLFYPSRRQPSAAFSAVMEALRFRT
ncbi:LysR family transcriptional regulator [Sphingomonas sp. CGMCC 1.13654]|uniref:LysR family transcriptional regulator n=1 Tax=Sphingomonas chungangi TaxID=2683589 RepID=A0A838L5K2_9SPHN|nr:LysR family transcriptional regulator [Sphingomonas chungangi]MBA2933892.1 LysR family transcriptional regulator [Sphingomonas chungangi]MVW55221.1 LysR family transcriptional regulator [Sphingomonas chungangi]